MSFARIATVASVTVLFALAGCDHAPPAPAAEQEPAAAAVPREAATESPSPPLDRRSAPPASPSKKPKPPTPVDVDAGSGIAGLDRFVAAVQQKLPEVALDRRDEEVEDLGEQACDALKAGRTATAAASEVADEGVAPADARTLVGLAKDDLCRS